MTINPLNLCAPSGLRMPKPCLESEATLIGGLILDSDLFVLVKDKLCPADFYSERNQKIFAAMKDLWDRFNAFDAPMLLDNLEFDRAEDMAAVYDLANGCASTANLSAHADIIREKSVQRQLYECTREVKAEERKHLDHKQLLVSFLEEIAAEIKATDIDEVYLTSMMYEVNKAFVSTVICLENEIDAGVEPFEGD